MTTGTLDKERKNFLEGEYPNGIGKFETIGGLQAIFGLMASVRKKSLSETFSPEKGFTSQRAFTELRELIKKKVGDVAFEQVDVFSPNDAVNFFCETFGITDQNVKDQLLLKRIESDMKVVGKLFLSSKQVEGLPAELREACDCLQAGVLYTVGERGYVRVNDTIYEIEKDVRTFLLLEKLGGYKDAGAPLLTPLQINQLRNADRLIEVESKRRETEQQKLLQKEQEEEKRRVLKQKQKEAEKKEQERQSREKKALEKKAAQEAEQKALEAERSRVEGIEDVAKIARKQLPVPEEGKELSNGIIKLDGLSDDLIIYNSTIFVVRTKDVGRLGAVDSISLSDEQQAVFVQALQRPLGKNEKKVQEALRQGAMSEEQKQEMKSTRKMGLVLGKAIKELSKTEGMVLSKNELERRCGRSLPVTHHLIGNENDELIGSAIIGTESVLFRTKDQMDRQGGVLSLFSEQEEKLFKQSLSGELMEDDQVVKVIFDMFDTYKEEQESVITPEQQADLVIDYIRTNFIDGGYGYYMSVSELKQRLRGQKELQLKGFARFFAEKVGDKPDSGIIIGEDHVLFLDRRQVIAFNELTKDLDIGDQKVWKTVTERPLDRKSGLAIAEYVRQQLPLLERKLSKQAQ